MKENEYAVWVRDWHGADMPSRLLAETPETAAEVVAEEYCNDRACWDGPVMVRVCGADGFERYYAVEIIPSPTFSADVCPPWSNP